METKYVVTSFKEYVVYVCSSALYQIHTKSRFNIDTPSGGFHVYHYAVNHISGAI